MEPHWQGSVPSPPGHTAVGAHACWGGGQGLHPTLLSQPPPLRAGLSSVPVAALFLSPPALPERTGAGIGCACCQPGPCSCGPPPGQQRRPALEQAAQAQLVRPPCSGEESDSDIMQQHATLASCPDVWRSISCPQSELRLDFVLSCGQSFRWSERHPGYWTGALADRVWTLTQTDDRIWYTIYSKEENAHEEVKGFTKDTKPKTKRKGPIAKKETISSKTQIKTENLCQAAIKEEEEEMSNALKQEPEEKLFRGDNLKLEQEILWDYFQLNINLGNLYKQWSASDSHFEKVAHTFPGVRILRQNPTECLFSFICTSNNHISRITGMIERLCQAFGRRLCQLDSVEYYTFPSLQALAGDDVEVRLRDLGFGYRAKFVSQSAQAILKEHGPDWLHSLRSVPYEEAKTALCALPGVGAKVADCVCLMALDKPGTVPIDTHVWQIAKRDYLPQLGSGNKSLTDRVYKEIGSFFQTLWGPYAGWTHSVLFCADLKKFKDTSEHGVTKKRPEKRKKEKV